MSYYYDFNEDIKKYPNAWCYIIIGGRKRGKTYSVLKSCYESNRKFTFVKRTNEDINLICGSGIKGDVEVDLSPFKPINRDLHCNIKAKKLFDGVGGFFELDEENNIKNNIGFILSLNAVSKMKGIGIDECDWMIFDEFIPQPWDRINRKEGEQILDLYVTQNRDREHRGIEEVKLIALANATSINNKLMETLELTDVIAEMTTKGIEYFYDEKRFIMVHLLANADDFYKNESNTKIFNAMQGTKWHNVVYENTFAYDDFNSVDFKSLKGYKCIISLKYKEHMFFIYRKNELYYMCESKGSGKYYDLNTENDQKRFFNDYIMKLREKTINKQMFYSKFSMYDLIINYKNYFKI